MSNSIATQTMLIGEVEVPVLEYQNQRVVTFAMIDKVHQRPEGTARYRFRDNRHRFVDGKHFYLIDYSEKGVFRPFGIEVPPRGLTVLTEHGYLFIVKSFTDDLAWKIQETLVDTYFRAREILAHPPLPYHIRRYLANQLHIPYNYFSILNELTIRLIAPLELQGYPLPDNMLPDISEGLLFNRWLRKEGIDPKEILTYIHAYEDGRRVKVKMYPIEFWPDFIKHFHEEWLPKRAHDYFQKRDPEALPFLPKLLEARMTKSLTELLKTNNAPYSAQNMNKILLDMGIIEEKTRPSSKGGEKKFKVFTEEGRIYGKNVVKPQKPEETQPRFYEDTFEQLLIMIRNYLDR
jgi:hypothetical protein